jgi:hypothetical protein
VRGQGVYQLALRGEPVDFARKPEFRPTSLDRAAIIEGLARRDRELADLLTDFRPDPGAFRFDWYGNEMGVAGLGNLFIQHESLHHGQWAAYAALSGHARPVGWVFNWGL